MSSRCGRGFRDEPLLRGRIRVSSAPDPDGVMGAPIELVVALTTSAGATMTIVARSMSRWLIERERQRRSDVVIKVTGPDGRQVSVSAKRVADAEDLLRMILEPVEPDPGAKPAGEEQSPGA
nr:hypothetical protein [Actinomadura sp. KC216]